MNIELLKESKQTERITFKLKGMFSNGKGEVRQQLTTRALQYFRPLALLNTTSLAYPGHRKILLDVHASEPGAYTSALIWLRYHPSRLVPRGGDDCMGGVYKLLRAIERVRLLPGGLIGGKRIALYDERSNVRARLLQLAASRARTLYLDPCRSLKLRTSLLPAVSIKLGEYRVRWACFAFNSGSSDCPATAFRVKSSEMSFRYLSLLNGNGLSQQRFSA